MERWKNEKRMVRMFVYGHIRLTIHKSSKLYWYVKARKQENKASFTLECSENLNHRIIMFKHSHFVSKLLVYTLDPIIC